MGEGEGYSLHVKDGKIRLHITKRWTDIAMRVETESSVPLNQWSHVIATYDGHKYASGVRIYIDGQPQKLKVIFNELNHPIAFKDPFRIGAGGGADKRFHGMIRDVRAYNRDLTPEEAGVLPLTQTASEIAAIPVNKDPSRRLTSLHCVISTGLLLKTSGLRGRRGFPPGWIGRSFTPPFQL